MLLTQSLQHAHHPLAAQGSIDLNGQALAREGIHDREGTEAPSITQRVALEVHGPSLMRSCRHR
jgi:hypothetical protein